MVGVGGKPVVDELLDQLRATEGAPNEASAPLGFDVAKESRVVAVAEACLRDLGGHLGVGDGRVDEEVEARLKKRLSEAEAVAAHKLEGQYAERLKELQCALEESHADVKTFREQELELRRQQRRLEAEKESLALEVARRLDAEREAIRAEALRKASEDHRLKDLEKEKVSTLAPGVRAYEVSGNGKVLVFQTKDGFTRVEAGATTRVNPSLVWKTSTLPFPETS